MFKPKRVVPNTLDPRLGGLDWAAMPGMFSDCLSTDEHAFRTEVRQGMVDEIGVDWRTLSLSPEEAEDVTLANLAGDGAEDVARRWADSGKMRRKLDVLLQYLEGPERQVVERLIRGDTFDDNSSQVEDIWHQVSLPPAGHNEPSNHKPTFQGRATAGEAEHAMARVRTGFSKPPAIASHDTDEDTDEDDEEAHARTAHYFFSSYIGMPSQLTDAAAASSSPIREATNNERAGELAKSSPPTSPLAPQLPITPRSRVSTQPPPARSADANAVGLENIASPRTPQHATSLGSPFQLLSPAPSTRKRRQPERDPPVMPALLDIIESTMHRNVPDYPVPTKSIDLHQHRKPASGMSVSKDHRLPNTERESKKRRIVEDEPALDLVQGNGVRQDRTAASPPTPAKLSRTDNLRASSPKHGLEPSSSSSRLDKIEERKMRSTLRAKIAQRLGRASSSVTDKSCKAKVKESGPPSTERTSPCEPKAEALHLPKHLRKSASDVSVEVEMDTDRIQQLANDFKEQYDQGLRPGVVIPLLECLESQ